MTDKQPNRIFVSFHYKMKAGTVYDTGFDNDIVEIEHEEDDSKHTLLNKLTLAAHENMVLKHGGINNKAEVAVSLTILYFKDLDEHTH